MPQISPELEELMQKRTIITERISSDKAELQKLNDEIERISLEQQPRAIFKFGDVVINGCYGFTNLAFGNPCRKELYFLSDFPLSREIIEEFELGEVRIFKINYDDGREINGICAIKSLKQTDNKSEFKINRIEEVKFNF